MKLAPFCRAMPLPDIQYCSVKGLQDPPDRSLHPAPWWQRLDGASAVDQGQPITMNTLPKWSIVLADATLRPLLEKESLLLVRPLAWCGSSLSSAAFCPILYLIYHPLGWILTEQ